MSRLVLPLALALPPCLRWLYLVALPGRLHSKSKSQIRSALRMSVTLVILVSASAARRSSISSPTAFVHLSLPHAGGERRAIDRPANTSRATNQEYKIEAPPDVVATGDLFSFSSEAPDWRGACASVDRADSSLLEVEQAELERSDQALGDPQCTRHVAALRIRPPFAPLEHLMRRSTLP